MSSNLFTGLGDLYKVNTPTQNSPQRSFKTFAGHVIEICMTSGSSLYESPRDIGKIKFRDLVTEYNRVESELTKLAYPLDRSIARYPFPGEEVIIYQAMGESDSIINTTLANIYFYSFVVSAMHNVSFNANPFFGTDAANINPLTQLSNLVSNLVDPNSAKTRFDVKIADINLVKDGSNKLKVYKQLQPFEGDFILQGRFGNTIRFGSTSAKNETPWSTGSNKPGISGDAVMVLRVDRDYVTNEESMLAQEDPDVDDASIYLCTSQRVLLTLGCSKELKTWKSRYNINDSSAGGASGAGSNVTKTRDTSELWQKTIESDQPVSQVYQSPTN